MLEVGCGLESIFLDIDSFSKLVIVEPAEIFYEKAALDIAAKKKNNVLLIKALLEDSEQQLKSEKFDFILVSSLFHEIPDQQKFLETLYQISEEKTIIHFNVPNAMSFHRLLAVEMGLIKNVHEPSVTNIRFQQHTVFDLALLERTLTESNFEVIESGAYSFKPFTHTQMQKMIDAGILTDKMLDGFYKMEKYMPELCSEIFVNVKKK